MMLHPPLEELLKKVDNRFSLCLLTSKRARQLVQGAIPMVHVKDPNQKNVTTAIMEIYNDEVKFDRE